MPESQTNKFLSRFKKKLVDVLHLSEEDDVTELDVATLVDSDPNATEWVEDLEEVIHHRIGRYEIVKSLGQRHHFMLFHARDPQLARDVAIKILEPEFASDPALAAQVRDEVETLAKLHHPAIVEVYDYDTFAGQPYIVMPLLKETLAQRLAHVGKMKLKMAASLLVTLATALRSAHKVGIVHGQLAPTNILFDQDDNPILSDFEIQALLTITNDNRDPAYLSPEQAPSLLDGKREKAHPPSDIYALGAIFFLLLTGHAPYEADTPVAYARAHTETAIPNIRAGNPTIPRECQQIIEKALAKNPKDRYQSLERFAREVKSLAQGRYFLEALSSTSTSLSKRDPSENSPKRKQPISFPPTSSIGRYHVERRLGRGAMASVYLAIDPNILRQVAIKVLPEKFMDTPQFIELFHREAKIVAKLDHEAVVKVYDFGEDDRRPYLVMQYLPGGTLKEKLAGGALGPRALAPIIERMANALTAAHALHIVHRDIKPANILFTAAGDASLSDFGIAVISSAAAGGSAKGSVGGTPKYMSPEQAESVLMRKSAPINARADIYSLGVVFFEMLTGFVPFRAKGIDLVRAHVDAPIPTLDHFMDEVPDGAQEIINRALAKSPNDRYPTAQAFAKDVKEMASGRWFLRSLF